MIRTMAYLSRVVAIVAVAFLAAGPTPGEGSEPLTFQDLMRFRKIENPTISRDGSWIGYALKPDRGEGEAVARQVDADVEHRVERGGLPLLSGNSRWLACAILPTQKERDEAADKKKGEGKPGKKDDDGPRNGMALVSLADGPF